VPEGNQAAQQVGRCGAVLLLAAVMNGTIGFQQQLFNGSFADGTAVLIMVFSSGRGRDVVSPPDKSGQRAGKAGVPVKDQPPCPAFIDYLQAVLPGVAAMEGNRPVQFHRQLQQPFKHVLLQVLVCPLEHPFIVVQAHLAQGQRPLQVVPDEGDILFQHSRAHVAQGPGMQADGGVNEAGVGPGQLEGLDIGG